MTAYKLYYAQERYRENLNCAYYDSRFAIKGEILKSSVINCLGNKEIEAEYYL